MKFIIGFIIGIILVLSLFFNALFYFNLRKNRIEIWEEISTKQQKVSFIEFWALNEPSFVNQPDTNWLKPLNTRIEIRIDSTNTLRQSYIRYFDKKKFVIN